MFLVLLIGLKQQQKEERVKFPAQYLQCNVSRNRPSKGTPARCRCIACQILRLPIKLGDGRKGSQRSHQFGGIQLGTHSTGIHQD